MITITDVLIAEHRLFTELFDDIEKLLPKLKVLGEVRLLSGLLERLLRSHADAEQNLAYVALDHTLKDKGQLDRLHQDHEEIDASLVRARRSLKIEEARRLLRGAIKASREHFRREERGVFPMIEHLLQPGTLAELGTARVAARAGLAR